jgi:hypothetical protein
LLDERRRRESARTARLGFSPSQQKDGLLFPQWTLAGVQRGWLLKPDAPRLDEKGKPIKYEAPAGSAPHFDLHPDAVHVLQDATIPLYFSEGTKKGDAAWSRGVPCVSITSVWMFLNGRLVVPDLDEILLLGRVVRVVFDSDVTRKASVAAALLRFCAALDRRGAKVEVVYLPEGPDGAKVGLDDWFVAGGTVTELEALARPWDGKGPGVVLRAAAAADPDEQARTIAYLIQAMQHPEHTKADLCVMAATMALTQRKQARGEVAPDGRVVLSAAEISDDYRPVPAKGDRKAEANPNGSKPRLARAKVKPLMQQAIARGLIAAEPVPINRTHTSGVRYRDVDWAIRPSDSLAAMLDPWATFRPAEPKQRKPRTITPPCPQCGEVHAITRIDYCGSVDDPGCGAQIGEPTIIEPKTAEERTLDNLSQEDGDPDDPDDATDAQDTDPHPRPPRLRIVAPIGQGTRHNATAEPDWLRDAPDSPPDDDPLAPRTLFALPPPGCRSCGVAVAEGHTHCRACARTTA